MILRYVLFSCVFFNAFIGLGQDSTPALSLFYGNYVDASVLGIQPGAMAGITIEGKYTLAPYLGVNINNKVVNKGLFIRGCFNDSPYFKVGLSTQVGWYDRKFGMSFPLLENLIRLNEKIRAEIAVGFINVYPRAEVRICIGNFN